MARRPDLADDGCAPRHVESLNQRFRFAILHRRPKPEVELTLHRFAPRLIFDPIIGMFDVANHKPAPDGLLQIRDATGVPTLYYVGDTSDDARARGRGGAFIGVAAPPIALSRPRVPVSTEGAFPL